jgi:ribosomal protein S18 acetylase RimI-like enzyme
MTQVRPVTDRDLDAVHELLARRNRALFGAAEITPELVRQRWDLPSFAGWVATGGGRLHGYASLDAAHELEHVADDDAIADALLDAALREAAARGFDTVTLISAPEDEATARLTQRRGFRLDRTILRMWRTLGGELPEPRWPDGVTVRTYEDADAATVKALLDRSYAGWDGEYVVRPLDDWVVFMTDHPEFDPGLWFLVERDGRLVACALHWREYQRRGWLKDIVVDETERGRGLGRALLQQGFLAYAGRGVDRVGLKVDAANPTGAPALYERVGFAVDRRYELWLRHV